MTNQAEFEHAVAANSTSTPDHPAGGLGASPATSMWQGPQVALGRFWSASISTGHLNRPGFIGGLVA
jgi:hypothetical protein